MKKSIRDFDLYGKKVIIRVDFNVPISDNKIQDDNRIISSLKTINYAIEKGAKVILMSHLGRIKTKSDKEKNSLKIVADRLSELLGKKVIFVDNTSGEYLEDCIKKLNNKDVLLIENTRFEDLEGKKESSNDEKLGLYWSTLGDIFINDAFGTSHRSHASNVGIASHIPSGIGFLIEDELEKFEILKKPKKPFSMILGGAKVSDKIGVIEYMAQRCDYVLIGGAMAFTFLKSIGYNVGASKYEEDYLDFCFDMLKRYEDKIILPNDFVVSKVLDGDIEYKSIDEFTSDDIGLDIGPKSINHFSSILEKSNTVVWNGPLGYFEIEKYSNGTKQILETLSKLNKTVIIGGGDTASAAINFGYKDKFTHISTGGGASLQLLEGKILPGIDVIDDK